MTDLNPKGLEAARVVYEDAFPGAYVTFEGMEAAIRAYIAASPTPPVEAEPDGWESYWAGAGSIDSVTRLTRSRFVMERWIGEGAEITPLYAVPPTVSALQARVRELEEERDRLTGALEISHFAPWLRGWVKTRFGKWITHNTAKGALAEYRAALAQVTKK